MTTFSRERIEELLPHGEPFLFLDHAEITNPVATARYCIRGDEPVLQGHFAGDPIFPASLMIEALGQLAVLILRALPLKELSPWRAYPIYFASCDGVRCHRLCRPGDELSLQIRVRKIRLPLAYFEGAVRCGEQRVAFAEEIVLAFAGDPET